MGIKLRAPFKRLRLRQRISTLNVLSGSNSRSKVTVNGGMKLRSQSEENLNKLNECMENMDDDVSKLFMECHQTDFRKDPELFRLLNDYFTTSKRVTELCESLRKCLERVKQDECLLIDETLRDFHEEKLGYGGLLEASFRKTFVNLNNYNDFFNSSDGDSDCDFLSGDFMRKTQICNEELGKMMVKLEKTMKEIDKKLRRVRGIRAIVVAALLAPVIAIMFVSKIMVGILGFVPIEPLTTFAAWRWNKSTETLKREKTAMTCMERETMVALKEVEKIRRLVSRLEIVERSIRLTTEFAIKKQSSLTVAMRGINKERNTLGSMIVDLDKETGRCNEFALFGRNVARDQIFQFLSHGDKSSK